jgi:hypothetical protein
MRGIDRTLSEAIYMEVGERLQLYLTRDKSELPDGIKVQLDRLREFEEPSPSIVPSLAKGGQV